MNIAERIIFWKRLSLYVRSGISLPRALAASGAETKRHTSRYLILALETRITRGESLSSSCAHFPKVFDSFTVNYLSAGETSGTLASTCERLAVLLERRRALTRQIASACIYPIIICFGTVGIALFLTFFIFPKIVPVLEGFHTKLPFTTRALLFVTTILQKDWLFIGIAAGISGAAIVATWHIPHVRKAREYIALHMPLVGILMRLYALATFFSMTAVLLKSGIRLIHACELATYALPGTTYPDTLQTLNANMAQGASVSSVFAAHPFLFPAPIGTLIDAGETTGTVRESFEYLGTHFETRLEDLTKQLTVLIEPALMIVMGFGVGFIALAIITPMYSVTQSISPP